MASYQLVVIGAGPGGYAAAFYAADLGMQVALVDTEENPGGVCLYRGCIPSKALLHVANVVHEAHQATAWGVTFAKPKIDLDKLRSYKDGVVQKLVGGLGQVAKLRKVTYVRGRASFVDAKTISVELVKGGQETITFEHAIVATGSRPSTVPGLSIDSPRVMDLRAATARIVRAWIPWPATSSAASRIAAGLREPRGRRVRPVPRGCSWFESSLIALTSLCVQRTLGQ